MSRVIRRVVFGAGALLVAAVVAGCGHYHGEHGYYRPHYREYRHAHRLSCGHRVECRYRGDRHYYEPHRSHRSYHHLHRRGRGYVACYVSRGGRHRY